MHRYTYSRFMISVGQSVTFLLLSLTYLFLKVGMIFSVYHLSTEINHYCCVKALYSSCKL